MRRSFLVLTILVAAGAFAADDVIRRGFNVAPGGTLKLDGVHAVRGTVVTPPP